MNFSLRNEIADAIKDRQEWERRQTTFYTMRHQGLKRAAKPHPNAADLHFALIDALVSKLKPFYFQQLYATEQFATFISLLTKFQSVTSAVGAWYDYKLKQQSNIEPEVMAMIDYMVMAGRAVIKVPWDVEEKRIAFDAVDPVYFVVPPDTVELQKAPWCVHIMHLSQAEYKENPQFRQDKTFLKSITGAGNDTGMTTDEKWSTVMRREGITYSKNDSTIILWEIYKKCDDRVEVQTYSPLRHQEQDQVRDPFTLSYEHNLYPFVSFQTEIKDKGWYSPRGVGDVVAAHEDSLCRLWNGKHDCMDYYNKPLFTNEGTLSNTANIRTLPGSTLPAGVKPVQMPSPPIDFDKEMQSTRALAEYMISIPDLGAAQHLTGQTQADRVTATQINAIVGQSGMSDDMRARVFRLGLGQLYKMCWSLYRQYDKNDLIYVLDDEQLTLPPDALYGEYIITPNGSADSWNKPLQYQKAVGRLQMFRGSPFWRQNELEKSVMEIDDPRLIKRLYQDPGVELKEQAEVQAQEISVMLLGFPASVKQSDKDAVHVQSLMGFIDRRVDTGEPITPEFARLCIMHMSEHDQAMMMKKDPELPQVRGQVAPLVEYLTTIASSDQAQNVIPMGGAAQGMTGEPSGAAPAPPEEVAKDVQDSAVKVINALTGALKAGVPVTIEQLNDAFVQGGLPPLGEGTAITLPPPVAPPKKNFSIKRADGSVTQGEISEGAA